MEDFKATNPQAIVDICVSYEKPCEYCLVKYAKFKSISWLRKLDIPLGSPCEIFDYLVYDKHNGYPENTHGSYSVVDEFIKSTNDKSSTHYRLKFDIETKQVYYKPNIKLTFSDNTIFRKFFNSDEEMKQWMTDNGLENIINNFIIL